MTQPDEVRPGDEDAIIAAVTNSFGAFCETLPRPYREYAELGSVIYIVIRGGTEDRKDNDAPTVTLQRLLAEVGQLDPLLYGLGVNLSEAAFNRNDYSKGYHSGMDYKTWAKMSVERLEAEIIDRMMMGTSSGSGHWLTSTDAAALAQTLGYAVYDYTLTRLAKQEPTPFLVHKPAHRRLEVELVSFLAYLKARAPKLPDEPSEKEERETEARKQEVNKNRSR
jgi:hypothetical protein